MKEQKNLLYYHLRNSQKLGSSYSKNPLMVKIDIKNPFYELFLELLPRILDLMKTLIFMADMILRPINKIEFSQRNDKRSANVKSKAT